MTFLFWLSPMLVTTHPPTPVFLSHETCDLKVEGGEGFQTTFYVMLAQLILLTCSVPPGE